MTLRPTHQEELTLAEPLPTTHTLDLADLVRVAARTADGKGGHDTIVLEVGEVLGITDYFVVTSASNTRLVKTIVEHVEEQVRIAGGGSPRRVEGLGDLHWVLMDYGDFVVHVFGDETREYYDLERLWGDVPRLAWGGT